MLPQTIIKQLKMLTTKISLILDVNTVFIEYLLLRILK